MSVAAQNSPRLFSSLRSSFADPLSRSRVNTVGAPTPQVTPASPSLEPDISVTDKLNLLDQVLAETEQRAQARVQPPAPEVPVQAPDPIQVPAVPIPAQAVPLAVDQAVASINQTYAGHSAKESFVATSLDQPTVEVSAGAQMVEVEQSPEMPVEVEGFIQEVKEHQDQLPHEIVVADGTFQLQSPALSLKPVVVLPITPEVEAVGAKKSTAFSVRWLVEWSRKLMKMFSGTIIYREA